MKQGAGLSGWPLVCFLDVPEDRAVTSPSLWEDRLRSLRTVKSKDMERYDGEPQFHSSGVFTLHGARQDQLLGRFSLEKPALAVLLLVQGAVKLRATALEIDLERERVHLRVRLSSPLPDSLPPQLERLGQIWGPATSLVTNEGLQQWTWSRPARRTGIHREVQLLTRRARFCPIPLRLNGYILQPENTHYPAARPGKWLRPGYHLAERYTSPLPDQPGLALFRPDANRTASQRPNTDHTYWREVEPGTQGLRWWMPWRVAGQVARHKACYGYRVGSAALLLAETGQPTQWVAVSQGVVVEEASPNWPKLPGLCLIFDASRFSTDLSGLKLVHSREFQDWLEEQRQQLTEWIGSRVSGWDAPSRTHNVTSRQNRREIGAWLSLWGVGLVTGVAMYLPLPLLGLPWIVWHHASRKKIFHHWRQRLTELGLEED